MTLVIIGVKITGTKQSRRNRASKFYFPQENQEIYRRIKIIKKLTRKTYKKISQNPHHSVNRSRARKIITINRGFERKYYQFRAYIMKK